MNKTKAVPTENKEVKENVLTNEQLEKLKKNLSPEETKQYEILASILENSNSLEEIKEKVSELTDEQLSHTAGGVESSTEDAKVKEGIKKFKRGLRGMGISSAFAGAALVLLIQNVCEIVEKIPKNKQSK